MREGRPGTHFPLLLLLLGSDFRTDFHELIGRHGPHRGLVRSLQLRPARRTSPSEPDTYFKRPETLVGVVGSVNKQWVAQNVEAAAQPA